ncbi:MAG: hypothetical protein U1E51_36320 [Candidatus Binatia bacterium]|nr:hypothetical protein [Candidatus Binatia bacterium]
MDPIIAAFAGLIGKISDPVTIVLLLLLVGSEWMRITQGREERVDRNTLVACLKEVTAALNEIKIAIAARMGHPL